MIRDSDRSLHRSSRPAQSSLSFSRYFGYIVRDDFMIFGPFGQVAVLTAIRVRCDLSLTSLLLAVLTTSGPIHWAHPPSQDSAREGPSAVPFVLCR